jgi:putative ABC transport system ATP-binding protein
MQAAVRMPPAVSHALEEDLRVYVLETREVRKAFGSDEAKVEALRGVDLQISAGEFVAIMGRSGSGKSTLLSLLGGVDLPTSGQILLEGNDLASMTDDQRTLMRRQRIGFIFQSFNLLPILTAEENVALPLELDGAPARHAAAQARALLGELGLAELAGRFPEELSGGEQQRVAIARAVVGERRLLLADEPTGALDSLTGEAVLRLLRGQCDHGCAAVLVTHDARHAAWADRVVFLRDGRLVDQTAPSDDLHDPRNPGVVT